MVQKVTPRSAPVGGVLLHADAGGIRTPSLVRPAWSRPGGSALVMGNLCRRVARRPEVIAAWRRLLRHLLRLRKRQLYFAYLGQHLAQAYPDRLRERLV